MDPVSLSVAAVALLTTGFGTGFAQEAGKSAWEAVQRVGRIVSARLGRGDDQRRALDELRASPDDPAKRAVVAEYIRHDLETDTEFAALLSSLVAEVQSHETGRTLIAHATGSAKQVNVAGDNFGPITFS
jgi:hypothetical protein